MNRAVNEMGKECLVQLVTALPPMCMPPTSAEGRAVAITLSDTVSQLMRSKAEAEEEDVQDILPSRFGAGNSGIDPQAGVFAGEKEWVKQNAGTEAWERWEQLLVRVGKVAARCCVRICSELLCCCAAVLMLVD